MLTPSVDCQPAEKTCDFMYHVKANRQGDTFFFLNFCPFLSGNTVNDSKTWTIVATVGHRCGVIHQLRRDYYGKQKSLYIMYV